MRDLQEALWQIVEPQIDSQGFAADSHKKVLTIAIQRFVEERVNSLGMAELADALYWLEQTKELFLEYLRSKGIAGDPVPAESGKQKQSSFPFSPERGKDPIAKNLAGVEDQRWQHGQRVDPGKSD